MSRPVKTATIMHVIGVTFLMALLSTRFGNSANDSVPKLNVRPSCEAAAAGAVIAGRDTKACLDDERGAQDQVTQNWSKYSPTDKAQCVGMVNTGGSPSYVELLSCLDIMKDSREIHKDELADPILENGKMPVRKLQPSYFDAISPKNGIAVETSCGKSPAGANGPPNCDSAKQLVPLRPRGRSQLRIWRFPGLHVCG